MHRRSSVSTTGRLVATAALLLCTTFLMAKAATAAPAPEEKFLHVQVSDTKTNGENVNVNLPLTVAEKVLPTINRGDRKSTRLNSSHVEISYAVFCLKKKKKKKAKLK